MAVGTYDANGIWHYGESDNIAPFSTTLNKLADSASSAITADRARISTLEAGSLSGLIPVVPSSVEKSGGTASVNGVGLVTFANVSSLSLNNAFTTNFANYKVIISGGCIASIINTALRLQMRLAGVNSAANFYQNGSVQVGSATPAAYTTSNIAWLDLGAMTTNNYYSAVFEIQSPRVATKTLFQGLAAGYNSGIASFSITGLHDVATAYDGLTLYVAAGTFSGTIQVFGYND